MYTAQVYSGVDHPSWGWNNFAPEMYNPEEPTRHWYRVWGIHFGTWQKNDLLRLVTEECERLHTRWPGREFVELNSEFLLALARGENPKEKAPPNQHSPGRHNSFDDGAVIDLEHSEFNNPEAVGAESCFEESSFNHTIDNFAEYYDGKYVAPDDSIPLKEDDVPYIFAVITLTTCPDWFKKNMLHAKKVQAKGTKALPVERAHPVVLVEGHEPACRDW
jgi:hypothetical protein